MCGIAGVVTGSRQRVSNSTLQAMGDSIAHRGPDDSGTKSFDGAGLAFRRLSILDLSDAGHQPMSNEDGSIWLVFNGEIYNYRTLRQKLINRGHVFHSQTDSETVIHAYEEFGDDCLNYLHGMFAFSIWDIKKRRLFAARDRFGMKPWYYFESGGVFYFASEIKAFIAAGALKPQLNYSALNQYFTFQNVLNDETLFQGVRLLPAGCRLSRQHGATLTAPYWEPRFTPLSKTSLRDGVQRIRHVFEQAVARHLMSDVPIGSHSSGGMDSASIVAVASRSIPQITTFTGGFDTTNASGLEIFFDERKDAELVARHFDTRQYEMIIHAGDMADIMPRLMWHLEDPRVGMCYQNFYINELASRFVKVVLAGTGGDELFAGYPWRYQPILNLSDPKHYHARMYDYWSRLIPDSEKPSAFTAQAWNQMRHHPARQVYDQVAAGTNDLNPLDRSLYFEMKTFLHGLLVVEDKVSSAHGLETRLPFLDYQLVELALRIPASQKLRKGVGKYVLRQAIKPMIPAHIFKKRKQGFSAPEETWYRGQAYDYTRSILLSEKALGRRIFRPDYVRRVLNQHRRGTNNHRLLIWSMLSLEWWHRVFVDGDIVHARRS